LGKLSFANILQTKEGIDGRGGAMEGNARLMTEEAKPLTKIARFLAQSISENASASTRLLKQPGTQERMLFSLGDAVLSRPTQSILLPSQQQDAT
jgi:hypothetical protein